MVFFIFPVNELDICGLSHNMQYEDIALSFRKQCSVITVIIVFNYSYEIQGKMTSRQVQGDIKTIRCYFFVKNENANTVHKVICVCCYNLFDVLL